MESQEEAEQRCRASTNDPLLADLAVSAPNAIVDPADTQSLLTGAVENWLRRQYIDPQYAGEVENQPAPHQTQADLDGEMRQLRALNLAPASCADEAESIACAGRHVVRVYRPALLDAASDLAADRQRREDAYWNEWAAEVASVPKVASVGEPRTQSPDADGNWVDHVDACASRAEAGRPRYELHCTSAEIQQGRRRR